MDGLVHIGANFMFVKLAIIVKELDPMHLVLHSNSYKIMFKIASYASSGELKLVKFGGIKYFMTFMVVDTNG
jgi:hypothetical protein